MSDWIFQCDGCGVPYLLDDAAADILWDKTTHNIVTHCDKLAADAGWAIDGPDLVWCPDCKDGSRKRKTRRGETTVRIIKGPFAGDRPRPRRYHYLPEAGDRDKFYDVVHASSSRAPGVLVTSRVHNAGELVTAGRIPDLLWRYSPFRSVMINGRFVEYFN